MKKGVDKPLTRCYNKAIKGTEVRTMTYKVRELANGRFGVYECSAVRETLVKSFKTREGAERWISKR